MLKKRIKKLNKVIDHNGDSVVYVMSRDQRVQDNHALIAAQKHANSKQLNLVVAFILYPKVKNRILEQYLWMIEGLKEIESDLADLNIPFHIYTDKFSKSIRSIENDHAPESIYFDFSPLRGPRSTKKKYAEKSKIPCYVVDTHNIVPVWEASDKQEVGARTIRTKIASKLDKYLIEPEKITKHKQNHKKARFRNRAFKNVDWDKLINIIQAESIDNYNPIVKPGSKNARKILNHFIKEKLKDYSEKRNKPSEDRASNLSAYFHFGQLSSLRAAIEIKNKHPKAYSSFIAKATKNMNSSKQREDGALIESVGAFLEESIIRKELSDNFCLYNKNYDSLKGAADWAKETLKDHISDKREHLYNVDQLENAITHDKAWNAAQTQMVKTGKTHGYMRMYWCKKILEWTKTPKQALEFAIYLNDKYELDGYDPNGYVGIMWSIAGVHDRGWTEREIFGKIRYMNYAGLERKFKIEEYIEKFNKL